MDKTRLVKKRWRKELKRRQLKKQRKTFLGVKQHSIADWDKLRKAWREHRQKIRAKQKKKIAKEHQT